MTQLRKTGAHVDSLDHMHNFFYAQNDTMHVITLVLILNRVVHGDDSILSRSALESSDQHRPDSDSFHRPISNSTSHLISEHLSRQEELKCHSEIHIFYNPASGGNKGADVANSDLNSAVLRTRDAETHVYLWDIRKGPSGQKPGFRRIREMMDSVACQSQPSLTRIIAAGGDGTVMWVISEAIAHDIRTTNVAFGTIPFGTGNDFAHAFGWGASVRGKLMSAKMKLLKELVSKWLVADVVPHDIWRVTISVASDQGAVLSVSQKSLSPLELDPQKRSFVKLMTNYFSMGTESKIGLGFDKRRTKSRPLNKIMYTVEGLKGLKRQNHKIGDLLESCKEGESVLFASNSSSGLPILQGNPSSIIFLNINSFAGGLNLWPKATHSGVVSERAPRSFGDQATGDGKIEVLTYQSMRKFAAEQFRKGPATGNGMRITQSRGPLNILFKPSTDEELTYMQVDGEYYAVKQPKSVLIEHRATVKVLKRNQTKEIKGRKHR